MPTLRMNPQGIDKLRQLGLCTSDSHLARSLHVSAATVSRLRDGSQEPGPRVIAGAIQAFGHSMFFELFKVVEG